MKRRRRRTKAGKPHEKGSQPGKHRTQRSSGRMIPVMTQTSSLNPEQRFTKENPCPVCGGHKDLAQGKSERCWGFLSEDRKYAHCTREEYAGNLEQHPNSDTFSHKLSGDCKCGVSHNGHNETVTNLSSFSRPTDVYKIKDDEGNLIALHERYDLGSRKKKFKWRRRPNGPANLGGLPVADLPLYGSEKARDWADDQMIILVEGEKPAEALWAREFCALGTVTGAKSTSNTKPLEVLRGRKVIVWPDEDSDGFSHMERVAHSLKGIASSVTFFQWEGAPDKADAADHPAILSGDEDALQDLLKELREAPEWEDRESLKDELEGKKGAHEGGNQADRLIGYAQDKVEKYFKDQNGEPHALVDGEPMPLNSRCYVWLRKLMFDREGGSCTAEALKS